jgi:hypothetical protein
MTISTRPVVTIMFAFPLLFGGLAGALAARATPRASADCIPYRTNNLPAHTHCLLMPWQVAEAGVGAQSIYLALAPGCFSGYPRTQVRQDRGAIRIRVIGWRPAINHGRLDLTCGSSASVRLQSPIHGRRIEGQSWPSRLRFGSLSRGLAPRPLGLPRLLGLSPAQALRVLWLYGFHGRVSGSGPEVVSQLPGWGLVGTDRSRPHPFSGTAELTAGRRISFPRAPLVRPGAQVGSLTGAVRFVGGPYVPGQRPAVAGEVVVDGAQGRLLARFHVDRGHRFHLRLAQGRYLLLDDAEGWIFCGPTAVRIRAQHTTRVTVPVGCGIP